MVYTGAITSARAAASARRTVDYDTNFVATSPLLEGIGGRYFEDCNEAAGLDPDAPNATASGVAADALDPADAYRLWELSLALLGRQQ
jgi:hypothetical protein